MAQSEELKSLIVEAMQQKCRFKDILKRIINQHPDATAAEIAIALRLADQERWMKAGQERSDISPLESGNVVFPRHWKTIQPQHDDLTDDP
ncbi:hypothetical protein [Microvirga sp. VF16]|uniref:hypothetical protein n=1 Tax=Microvirga sp. VF16 TaxID=2807101 RepID=UPI00193CBBA4|nr:hypothetical protein [Microvirga sp. VF16]QRM35219.1 hypothetical protein JO965_40280 [Microvirga sp. VF16]